jgi:hypothetical protein
LKIIGL